MILTTHVNSEKNKGQIAAWEEDGAALDDAAA